MMFEVFFCLCAKFYFLLFLNHYWAYLWIQVFIPIKKQ